jgi:YYY domain-containing protein
MFFEGAIKKGLRAPAVIRYCAGILSGLAVCIMGNSHSFFYDEKSFGNKFIPFFEKLGAEVGKADNFFYPNSTRYIGHNPDLRLIDGAGNVLRYGDYTIHEFPFYSYLIGDLHAHVVSMMIVLLIVAVLFVFVFRNILADNSEEKISLKTISDLPKRFLKRVTGELKPLLKPEIIVTAVLLSLCMMCNYWDFLIYFVFSAMALLLYHALSSRRFLSIGGVIVFLFQIASILLAYLKFSSNAPLHVAIQIPIFLVCAIGASLFRTGMGMSFLLSAASLISLPFQYHFEMISNAIGLVDIRTAPYQFFILWFVHVLFAVILIILVICDGSPMVPKKIKRKPDYVEQRDPRNFFNPVARFLGTRNRADIFMCGMAVVGFLMLLAPEIIHVKDIYQGDYDRTNTMFKFAFAAFIMLSLVLGYTLFRTFSHVKKDGERSGLCIVLSIVLALLLFIPGHYTLLSLEQRTGKITMDAYKGLDGTEALRTRVSPQLDPSLGTLKPYAEAIDYFNENVRGTPVICEAYGSSYSDHCVVSAYTGLPTIFGWLTHEWLWRFQGIVGKDGSLVQNPDKPHLWKEIIDPRHLAVDTIYTSTDAEAVRYYLEQYQVEYIIVGALERSRYGEVNEEGIQSLGDIIFSTDDLYIVKVTG